MSTHLPIPCDIYLAGHPYHPSLFLKRPVILLTSFHLVPSVSQHHLMVLALLNGICITFMFFLFMSFFILIEKDRLYIFGKQNWHLETDKEECLSQLTRFLPLEKTTFNATVKNNSLNHFLHYSPLTQWHPASLLSWTLSGSGWSPGQRTWLGGHL